MFARYPILATREVEDVVARIRQTGTMLAPRRRARIAPAGALIRGRWLSRLSLSYVRYGFGAHSAFMDEAETYNLSMPLAGTIALKGRRDDAYVSPGMAALMSPGESLGFDLSGDLERLIVRFSANAVLRQYILLFDCAPVQPVPLRPIVAGGSSASQSMLRQIFATVRRLDRRDSHPDRDPFWDEIESNLLSALLLVCMQEQPKSAEFAASAGMRRAMDYVHANARQSLTLADLVAASGIPGRTLFRHFRAATGAGPVGYLRRVRLAAVRDELLAGAGESVAAVAQRWGFHDLGRFAGVYRSQYGENPSSTLRLAR